MSTNLKLKLVGLLSATALFLLPSTAFAATGSGYIPFPAGTTVHVYQANGSDPGCTTHCTQPDYYAWDFGAPSGSSAGVQIVSATSGTVIGLRNSYQGTCTNFYSSCAFGNYVFVHNDDGTYLEYLHMKYGSVAVAVGEHITPGTPIGQVGATGYTGGFAHLHFSWLASASGTGNSPSVGNSTPGSFIGIGHPTTGQNIVSNNSEHHTQFDANADGKADMCFLTGTNGATTGSGHLEVHCALGPNFQSRADYATPFGYLTTQTEPVLDLPSGAL